jgi:hypothetical protein
MKLIALLSVLVVCSMAWPEGDQAYLGIFAETKVMKMPGMGDMPDLSQIPKEFLDKMPNIDLMMGKPQMTLNVRLWSPGLAPPDATAWLAPPSGLKQGPRLDLDLYRPQPVTPGEEGQPGPGGEPGMPPEFTIKIYWGSSETVKPGQPKIITFGGTTPENRAEMQKQARAMQAMGQMLSSMGPGGGRRGAAGGDYSYKPDWTTGYWPTDKQPGKIAQDASLVGTFALTSFCGSVSLDVPSNVTFLAPIDLVSPDLAEMPALDGSLHLEWKTIPNLLGIHGMLMGMEGKSTMILWLSSEVLTDETTGLDWDYLQMAQVRDLVEKTVLMKGDNTKATVPAGIFKNCDMVMMQMIGYGPGVALNEGQPLPRLQTKTSFSSMLGGKGMNMGGR